MLFVLNVVNDKKKSQENMEIIKDNYNELSDYVVENPNTIVYVSVLENEEIREFEKKFKNFINKKTKNKVNEKPNLKLALGIVFIIILIITHKL